MRIIFVSVREGFENLNATRMSVARCGWTQRNLNFLPVAENANQVLSPVPEKPTSFDLSVFQLSAPFGAWSLFCKWSCPADSEVSAEVSGVLNFTLRKAQNITMPIAIFSHRQSRYFTKTVRVRIHTQTHRKYLFYSAYTKIMNHTFGVVHYFLWWCEMRT